MSGVVLSCLGYKYANEKERLRHTEERVCLALNPLTPLLSPHYIYYINISTFDETLSAHVQGAVLHGAEQVQRELPASGLGAQGARDAAGGVRAVGDGAVVQVQLPLGLRSVIVVHHNEVFVDVKLSVGPGSGPAPTLFVEMAVAERVSLCFERMCRVGIISVCYGNFKHNGTHIRHPQSTCML